MAFFCETREDLLLSYDENLTNDREFVLLYNLNTSNNFYYPYWYYSRFDWDDTGVMKNSGITWDFIKQISIDFSKC